MRDDGEDLRRALLARGASPARRRTSSASTASSGRRCCSSAGYELPKQLFVHGYLTLDQRKISKSLGNVIEPLDLVDVYGADAVRFYLIRAATFGQDGNASIEDVHTRYERELGNDLGNLLSRTTALIARSNGGRLAPAEVSPELAASDRRAGPHRARPLRRLGSDGRARCDLGSRADGSTSTSSRRSRGSWPRTSLGPKSSIGFSTGLPTGFVQLPIAVSSYLPETAPRILAALGQPDDLAWENVAPGRAVAAEGIQPAEPLFPRVELADAAA